MLASHSGDGEQDVSSVLRRRLNMPHVLRVLMPPPGGRHWRLLHKTGAGDAMKDLKKRKSY